MSIQSVTVGAVLVGIVLYGVPCLLQELERRQKRAQDRVTWAVRVLAFQEAAFGLLSLAYAVSIVVNAPDSSAVTVLRIAMTVGAGIGWLGVAAFLSQGKLIARWLCVFGVAIRLWHVVGLFFSVTAIVLLVIDRYLIRKRNADAAVSELQ